MTWTRRLTGIVAIGAILGFLVGVPLLLATASRAFLPDSLPALESLAAGLLRPDDGTFLVAVLVVAGWVVWGALMLLVLVEVVAALRGVRAPSIPGLRAPQHLIRRLVAAAALAFLVMPAPGVATAATGPVGGASTAHVGGLTATDAPRGAAAAHAAPVAGTATGAPASPAAGAEPAAEPATPEPPRYVVGPGESLWSIAEAVLGDGRRFTEIADLNRDVLGGRPGFLRGGWELRLPAAADSATEAPKPTPQGSVTVEPGDTLWHIAGEHLGQPERFAEIAQLNDIVDPDLIRPGDVIDLPVPSGVATADGSGATPGHAVPAPPAAAAPDEPSTTDLDPASDRATVLANKSAHPKRIPAVDDPAVPDDLGIGATTYSTPENDALNPVDRSAEIDAQMRPAAHSSAADSTDAIDSADSDAEFDVDKSTFPTRTVFGLGALAAAGVVSGLAARRVLQQRRRRSGERTPLASVGAAATERHMHAVADLDGILVVDRALRHLARTCTGVGLPVPELAALHLTDHQLIARLGAGATLPAPWVGEPGSRDWAVARDDALALDADSVAGVPAPYPAIVTLGQSEDGHLLVDLEQVGAVGFLGDERTVRSVIAALALELATSAWADDLQVTVAGTLSLLAESLDTGRVRYVPTVAAVLTELEQRASADRSVLADHGMDTVRDARAARTVEGTWTPEIVLVAAPTTPDQRERMARLVSSTPRVALAFVTAGDAVGEWRVSIAGDLARVAPLGMTVRPQVLPFDRLDDAQELFAVTGPDEPMIVVDPDALARPEVTLAEIVAVAPRADDATSPPSVTWWPSGDALAGPAAGPARAGSTDPELGPDTEPGTEPDHSTDQTTDQPTSHSTPAPHRTGRHVRQEGTRMEALAESPPIDTTHDAVVAVAPHLRLLGPIRLEGARGPVESKKLGSLTELCAYLALNPGASSEAVDESVWPSRAGDNTSTRTTATSKLRRWLGKTPDGDDYFPVKGAAGYVLDSRITSDVQRWDELVGGAPETAPTAALHDALLLVRGRPFLDRGRGRYSWADPVEQRLIDEIGEAAHELARRRIAEGRWRSADAALAVGIRVEPTNERLLRLRIRIAQASLDPERVAEARARLERIAEVLDCDLEPETEDLLDSLDRGEAPASASAGGASV